MNGRNKFIAVIVAVTVIAAALLLKQCGQRSEPVPAPVAPEHVPVAPSTAALTVPVAVPSQPVKKSVAPTPDRKQAKAPASAPLAPPEVKIFKELIPKNITIVRVYYEQMITGPASTIAFDINGSGFNEEFERMITVESGQPNAAVKNLKLITPNQIHGELEVGSKSATMVAFMRVLIQGKVVFQAQEPFAVIRPGEALNLIFTEMGENGRSGRFRVFTNITPEMFEKFKVTVSTPAIQIADLAPSYPFIVDGTVLIGPAVGGEYDMAVLLGEKNIWSRKGIVRVVRPNVGQSGLIQKVTPVDGFHRPGDKAKFSVQGSGFQPQDVTAITAKVEGLDKIVSSFTYISPGRLELTLTLPADAAPKNYGLTLLAGTEVLQNIPDLFTVVDRNWTRLLDVRPALTPGGTAQLLLAGRDLDLGFVSKLKVEVDEPELKIGEFKSKGPHEAVAPIAAGPNVKPGDYLIHLTSGDKPVNPEFGNVIRITSK